MNFSPRARREVSSLPPGLEAMLRGSPRVSTPGDLKASLFAAYARRQDVRTSGARFRALRERLAFPAIVTASAAAVLLAGAFLRDGSGDRSGAWVQLHPATAATPTRARVVDVDDPSLDVFGRTGTLLAAVPAEGP